MTRTPNVAQSIEVRDAPNLMDCVGRVRDALALDVGRQRAAMYRTVLPPMEALERVCQWSESLQKALDTYERWGLFNGIKENNPIFTVSPQEVRDSAPNIKAVMHALQDSPALLAKIEEGFTTLHPVPFFLSHSALIGAMNKAIMHYHSKGTLRSSNGEKLTPDTSQPVWMYEENAAFVYSPARFDPKDHGGSRKSEMGGSSRNPGWQILLTENLRDIPSKGKGKIVGGRPQIEAGHTPDEYLAMLGTGNYANEQGPTLVAWQSMFLTRLTETDGEVLDDSSSGSACCCTGQYCLTFSSVPRAFYYRDINQVVLDGAGPGKRNPVVGLRPVVRVL